MSILPATESNQAGERIDSPPRLGVPSFVSVSLRSASYRTVVVDFDSLEPTIPLDRESHLASYRLQLSEGEVSPLFLGPLGTGASIDQPEEGPVAVRLFFAFDDIPCEVCVWGEELADCGFLFLSVGCVQGRDLAFDRFGEEFHSFLLSFRFLFEGRTFPPSHKNKYRANLRRINPIFELSRKVSSGRGSAPLPGLVLVQELMLITGAMLNCPRGKKN